MTLLERFAYHRTMNVPLHIATANVANLIGEGARAQILLSLLSGRALTAGELAGRANISPQTASSHLSQLVKGQLLTLEKQGRHRYYRLAGEEVARAIESLMALTPQVTLSEAHPALEPIHFARTCYDHLAGRLGVAVTDALLEIGWLEHTGKNYTVTADGERGFASFDIDVTSLKQQRRQFARQCLDWTERRHHLAGSLGAALTQMLLERKWIFKQQGSRTVHLTQAGQKELTSVLGVRL